MAELFENRRLTVAVVSTVATSLTAMIVGAAPVSAKPGGGGGSQQTTTAEAPAPEASHQKPQKQQKEPKSEKPAKSSGDDSPKQQPATDPPKQDPPQQETSKQDAPKQDPPKQTEAPKQTETPEPTHQAPAQDRPTTAVTQSPTSTVTPDRPKPSDEAKPSEHAKPADDTTPSDHAKPSDGTKPSEDAKPSERAKPSDDAKPADHAKPSDDAKPSDEAKPSEDAKSSERATPAGDSEHPTRGAKPARPISTLKPETLQAPEADIDVAKAAPVVELKPEPAPKQDVADLAKIIRVADFQHDNRAVFDDRDRRGPADRRGLDRPAPMGRDWDDHVRQWKPDWVQYDDYYRPVICNPYHDTVRIVYQYQGAPRIVYVPPLQRVVMEVADLAAYSFTAVVLNAVNTAVNVAVGSFFGGGYYPGVGMPPPPPPPPVLRYDNVPVQVRYSQATYEPFRVQRVVDVGPDPQYGEHKVLLDGVTPAWGDWTQNAGGERQFEVHKTQQFPGLDQPREAPLPGDYQLRLLSDEKSADDGKKTGLTIAAIACGVLSLGAIGASVLLGRRRRES